MSNFQQWKLMQRSHGLTWSATNNTYIHPVANPRASSMVTCPNAWHLGIRGKEDIFIPCPERHKWCCTWLYRAKKLQEECKKTELERDIRPLSTFSTRETWQTVTNSTSDIRIGFSESYKSCKIQWTSNLPWARGLRRVQTVWQANMYLYLACVRTMLLNLQPRFNRVSVPWRFSL